MTGPVDPAGIVRVAPGLCGRRNSTPEIWVYVAGAIVSTK